MSRQSIAGTAGVVGLGTDVDGSMFDLSGRLATGLGSRGIGFTLARGLARAGARVVLNARTTGALDFGVADLRAEGLAAEGRAFDVTDSNGVDAAIGEIEEKLGPIDILVNNAGTQHRAPLQDFPLEAWQRLLDANLTSVFLVGQAVGRRMVPRGRGR